MCRYTEASTYFTGEMAHFEIHMGRILTADEVAARAVSSYKDTAYTPSPPPSPPARVVLRSSPHHHGYHSSQLL